MLKYICGKFGYKEYIFLNISERGIVVIQINDTVLDGAMGVCRVDGIEKMKFGKERKKYYILKAVNGGDSTFYVPVDSEELVSKIKRILSVDEIFEIIKQVVNEEDIWVEDDNERRIKFGTIVGKGDRKELMLLVRSLYNHKLNQEKIGKKFHAVDERCLKDAERLLHDEFSYVLNLTSDQIPVFIEEQIALITKW